ncbi:MAG TPA: DUF5615 family PIN-like protein [Planctomycetota bacterium]|jgi:predicted nuclease of predicted toxin-antitoxin system|nr:DUF5615 family PIN-like protein [Planctomycetota bacterium]
MARFLADEDLPRSLVRVLQEAGIQAEDVRDTSLRGRADEEVVRYASARSLALLTGDVGLGHLLRFRPGPHPGVVIVRFPNEVQVATLNAAVLRALKSLSDDEIADNVVVIEPGRIRLRRRR